MANQMQPSRERNYMIISCCLEKQVNFQNVFNDFSIGLGLASLFGGVVFPVGLGQSCWPIGQLKGFRILIRG
jgi:hypothetical protein